MKRVLIVFAMVMVLASTALAITPSAFQRYNADWFSNATGSGKATGILWMRDVELKVDGGSQTGTGKVFYVDSGVANAGNGTNWANAKATLDEAVGLCTANRGDIIKVAQGHAESLGAAADEVDLDIAGIRVIGIGEGSLSPTFTYTGDVTGAFAVGAANITIENVRFLAGVSDVNEAIDQEAAGDNLTLINCRFPKPTTNSFEFLDSIAVAATADGLRLFGCEAYNDEAGAAPNHFINAGNGTAGPVGLQVVNCIIKGDFAVAAVWSDEPCDEAYIAGNTITNHTSGQHAIEFTDTGTGTIAFNSCFTDDEATAIDPGSMNCFENYVATAVDVAGVIFPARDDTAQNLLGVNDASNAASTSAVTSDADGSVLERLEYVQYWAEKSITMTATAADDDLFDVDGGRILITGMVGLVSTEIGGGANTLALEFDADAVPDIDSAFTTAVDIDGDVVGTRYTFTAAAQSVLVPVSNTVGNSNLMAPWFCGEGMIEQNSQGSPAGAIIWHMTYRPLEAGVTVTAQ